MVKRLADDSETDLTEEGYVVGASPVKISRSNNKYFNGKIQTEHKTYNFVCYASEKAADYQAAERMNSPIQLSNIKLTPSIIDKETLDIQITKKSSVQVIKKLNFQKKVETDTKPKSEQTVTTLSQISDVDTTSTHIVVSINLLSMDHLVFRASRGHNLYLHLPRGGTFQYSW